MQHNAARHSTIFIGSHLGSDPHLLPDGNCKGVSSYSCNRWADKCLLRKGKPDCIFLSIAPDDILLVTNCPVHTQAIQNLRAVPNFICSSVLPVEITGKINPCREKNFIWSSVKSRHKGWGFFPFHYCCVKTFSFRRTIKSCVTVIVSCYCRTE